MKKKPNVKFPIKFRKTDLKSMQHDAKYWAGISFTLKQIENILLIDKGDCAKAIWDDFEQVGHPSGNYGMDTAVRDIWFSAIGHHYTGRDWPLNMDGEEVSKKFFAKLRKGLDNDNIKYS